MEVWKEVQGYEGIYQISSQGRIRNKCGKVRCPGHAMHGYLQIGLSKAGTVKYAFIHRLVAEAFIENPYGYKEVNHIDENKNNNFCTNLEWVSRKYNTNYGNRPRKVGKYAKVHGSNTISQYNRENIFLLEFRSLREAEKITGFCRQSISKYLDSGILYQEFYWKRG